MHNGNIGSTETVKVNIEEEEVAPIVVTGKKDGVIQSRQINESFFTDADEYYNDIYFRLYNHIIYIQRFY